jgi:hypothetical protein
MSVTLGSRPRRPEARQLGVKGRKSHPEQIWSALPQIADIDFSRDDFSVGPLADIGSGLK